MEGFRRNRNRNGHRAPARMPVPASTRLGGRQVRSSDIHVCPRCASELVQPRSWAAVDMRRWRVELSCPECEWEGAGVFEQEALDRYDELLDEGAALLVRDLQELTEANMRDDVEGFCSALAADLILPEDF